MTLANNEPPPLNNLPQSDAPGLMTPRQFFRRPVLYPNVYVWYLLAASLDVMVTWVILHLEGREMNGIADWVINNFDLAGAVIFKFSLVVSIVIICEIVGRQKPKLGLKLAEWSVAITVIPVVIGLLQIIYFAVSGDHDMLQQATMIVGD